MNKFWNFKKVSNTADDNEEITENILTLNGPIAEESWWGDEITPKLFKSELNGIDGDLTVFVNSPGGDCFAASEIYNALKEHKGKITIKVDSLAASAASVIAMAGDVVLMSPVSMMMCHNPSMMLCGEVSEFEKGIDFLNEIKESIINAYQNKTGLSRAKISKMMDSETWMNAKSAFDLGFCDKIMYSDNDKLQSGTDFIFDKTSMVTNTVSAMRKKLRKIEKEPQGTDISQFETRLNLLK